MEAVAVALVAAAEGAGAGVLLRSPAYQAERWYVRAQFPVEKGWHGTLRDGGEQNGPVELLHEAVLLAAAVGAQALLAALELVEDVVQLLVRELLELGDGLLLLLLLVVLVLGGRRLMAHRGTSFSAARSEGRAGLRVSLVRPRFLG